MATDLTPKFKKLKTADEELRIEYVAGERPIGESIGGMLAFSNVFRKGYGDDIFGIDNNGVWLGAADFVDAPVQFYMDGYLHLGASNVKIDGVNKRIIINDGTNDRVIIGYQSNGF